MKKRFVACFLSLAVLFLLIASVSAMETVTVPPFGDLLRTLNLNVGDRVNGTCSANPAFGHLYVLDPRDSVIDTWIITSDKPVSFSFTAQTAGSYTIRYWNMDIIRSATVTLDYTTPSSLQDYLRGNILLITIMIVVLVLVLVSISAYVWNSKSKKKNNTKYDMSELLPQTAFWIRSK